MNNFNISSPMSMSPYTLYYSNYCGYCKKIIDAYRKSQYHQNTNYHCLDNLSIDERGLYYIRFVNQQTKQMETHFIPPNITDIPALLFFDKTTRTLVLKKGNEIMEFLHPNEGNVFGDIANKDPDSYLPIGGGISGVNVVGGNGSNFYSAYDTINNSIPTMPESKKSSSTRMTQDEMNEKMREYSRF